MQAIPYRPYHTGHIIQAYRPYHTGHIMQATYHDRKGTYKAEPGDGLGLRVVDLYLPPSCLPQKQHVFLTFVLPPHFPCFSFSFCCPSSSLVLSFLLTFCCPSSSLVLVLLPHLCCPSSPRLLVVPPHLLLSFFLTCACPGHCRGMEGQV